MSIETALKATKANQGTEKGAGAGTGNGTWGTTGDAPIRSKRGIVGSSTSKGSAASSSSSGEMNEIDYDEK